MNEPREGRPGWYERLRTDDAFPGPTFTADHKGKIEQRALSGEKPSRRLSLRYGMVACVIVLALAFVAMRQFGAIGDKGLAPAGGDPEPIPTASVMPISKVELVSTLKGFVNALPEPVAYSGFVFEANRTELYNIGEIDGEYIQITGKEGTGWIPKWYVKDESTTALIEPILKPEYLIVDKPVTYRMYPEQPKPTGFELRPGQVVKVLNKYEGWVDVQVMTYDSAYWDNKWVREDELHPYDDGMAKEGYLNSEIVLYDEGRQYDQTLPEGTIVLIQGEKDGRYLILATGGVSGYIDKAKFSPNPFLAQTKRHEEEAKPKFYLKGPARALPESQPYANHVIFEGNTTDTYTVAETAADFSKIVDKEGQSGWIPSWYLVGPDDNGVREQTLAEPYVMLVDKPVTYRLYPDEPTPTGFELWSGKVVQVVGTYGDDWLEINVVTYDSPYMENKWVRKDELIPYDAGKAKEGYIGTAGAQISGEEGGQQELPLLTRVYIEREEGDRYWVTAGGGAAGYLNKADFAPNPFNIKVVDQ